MNKIKPEELIKNLKSVGLAEEVSPYLVKGINSFTEKDEVGGYLAVEDLKNFIKKKLPSLEQAISGYAKGGMRSYTKDELLAYEQSKMLIDLLESTGGDSEKLREYWLLHRPVQHKTIKESISFDSKGEETEVLDKVIERFSHGQDDDEDRRFLEEIDKRLGEKTYIEWVEKTKAQNQE